MNDERFSSEPYQFEGKMHTIMLARDLQRYITLWLTLACVTVLLAGWGF